MPIPTAALPVWVTCVRPGCRVELRQSRDRGKRYCSKPCRLLWQVASVVVAAKRAPLYRNHAADVEWLHERLPIGNTKPLRLEPDDYDMLTALKEAYFVGVDRVG